MSPYLAPTKHSLEEVMMWQLSPPRAETATRAGTRREPKDIILSAKVTATALEDTMATGSSTARYDTLARTYSRVTKGKEM